MNRRALLSTSTLIPGAIAVATLTACASTATTIGTAIGSGAVAKAVSYVQSFLTAASVLAASFVPTNTQISTAIGALEAFATSIGTQVAAGASWLTGTTATQFGSLASSVVTALQAGLGLLPGGATLTLAQTVLAGLSAAIPSAVSFFNSLFASTQPAPLAAAAMFVAAPVPAVKVLRLMVQ